MSFLQAVKDAYPDPPRPSTLGGGLPATTGTPNDTPYGMAALSAECDAIAAMPADSGRNAALNVAATRMGSLIAAGRLTEATVLNNLAAAARACGLPEHEIRTVLRDNANGGLATGKATPRVIAERTHIPTGVGRELSPPVVTGSDATRSHVTPPAEADSDADATPEHTSWWFRDLDGVIDGTQTEPGPVHLTRSDGQALFYAGKVNGLIGESESGKTWVALLAVQQALAGGERVLYLDFEDSASGIVGRLRALGTGPDDLARFAYIDPDETLHIAAKMDLGTVLDTHQPGLIVLDGFNAAMTLLGLDLQSNKDATTFSQALLKPLSRTAATVVYIDHLPKNREAQGKGGIGAQAKRAMTTGCALRVDIAVEFGRGMTGRLKLTVDKDRAGHVRAASAGAKVAGQAVLVSAADGTTVDMHIEAPDLRPADERGPFRPTGLMEKVSRYLETVGQAVTKKVIESEVEGKAEYVRAAVDALVEEGYAARQAGPRGSLLHTSIRPFRDDQLTSSHLVPPRPGTRSNQDIRRRPSSPTLGGDEDDVDGEGPGRPHLVPPDRDEVEEQWWQK